MFGLPLIFIYACNYLWNSIFLIIERKNIFFIDANTAMVYHNIDQRYTMNKNELYKELKLKIFNEEMALGRISPTYGDLWIKKIQAFVH